jgi:NADH-quinone oxidoreductase subunit G
VARPEKNLVTFEIDGREVTAPEGTMLVDAAKHGDVEIPFFCYEPKLGPPVGACRMCLVEIEGIPKLQTSCSTPVKDGMVVNTTSDRVRAAQNAIVEFLLVNHPLDCPVCDKGGECPLQDITFGWGPGRSRFIEPKRHFKKPLELSPLVAIDRERCILCYRCVRFSQEIAEDHQLVFLERGDHTFVGTHDGRPYVAPFSGNIIELCPVGALTSTAYRFRARPWDVEEAGTICTLCPSQCNVSLTVRDDTRVVRVLARDNDEVDDGWLCDKGRFAYQSFRAPERITAPLVRDGGFLREVPWERALSDAVAALTRSGERTAAIVGGQTTNEEGFLVQHLLREGLGSGDVDSRPNGAIDAPQARLLARPDLSARVSDIDHATTILVLDTELVDEAPILDLRVRKAVRRNHARLVVASSRPSTLDANADVALRFAPGSAEGALGALAAALGSPRAAAPVRELARAAALREGFRPGAAPLPGARDAAAGAPPPAADGAAGDALVAAASLLRADGDLVIIWGERVSHGERGLQAVEALLAVAEAARVRQRAESGLIEVPAHTNGRGLREVGCVPNMGPGLDDPAAAGRMAAEVARSGEVDALLLVHADPERELPESGLWRQTIEGAGSVIAFASFLTESLERHADVVFPAEIYPEKEGTITHPDGRLQRVRQAVARTGEVRPEWQVLADLCERAGAPVEALTAPMVTGALSEAVPFYAGISLDEIGGRGVRWQDRDAASALPAAEPATALLERPPAAPEGMRLGAAASLWIGREVEHAPSLRFLRPRQSAELSPADAERLGLRSGDDVVVAADGQRVRARARIRTGVPEGSVFLLAGTDEDSATALMNGVPRVVEVSRP